MIELPVLWAEVAKTFRFEAAHHLPNHGGKCARPHGHSYRVEVAVYGPVQPPDCSPDEGMVIDFDALTSLWKGHLEPMLDHRDLNDVMDVPTTAENIAGWIGARLSEYGLKWSTVTVWETENCRATVQCGLHA